MRKLLLILAASLLMAGCSAKETFETLGVIQHQVDVIPPMAEVMLALPEDVTAETFWGSGEAVYECSGYTLALQTLSSGDLHKTVAMLSGFSPNQLAIVESMQGEVKRYDWVWTAVGEEGELICRASVLDDGSYHYCIYTIAPAETGGKIMPVWNNIFASFQLQ